jgi:hypothetical protein
LTRLNCSFGNGFAKWGVHPTSVWLRIKFQLEFPFRASSRHSWIQIFGLKSEIKNLCFSCVQSVAKEEKQESAECREQGGGREWGTLNIELQKSGAEMGKPKAGIFIR